VGKVILFLKGTISEDTKKDLTAILEEPGNQGISIEDLMTEYIVRGWKTQKTRELESFKPFHMLLLTVYSEFI
jgi:hypothetical protein